MSSKVGHSITIGAAWMVGLRMLNRLIGVVNLSVLARLLVPADFGLVGLGMTVLAFFDMFSQTQVDVALIRDQEARRDHYDSGWTIELVRNGLLALLLTLTARPIAIVFSEDRLEAVLYVIALIQIVGAFENIGVVDFRKNLEFGRDFAYQLASRLAGTSLTIGVAYVWRNHWALVAGTGLQTLSRVILSYSLSSYRPRLSFARFREIFDFSKWIILQNLFFGLRDQAPVFVVGRLLNLGALGLFNLADEISGFITTEFRAPIRRALYPGFARMSVASGELKSGFLDAFSIMLLLSLPLSLGLYETAPVAVEVLLGSRWLPAVPILQILAIFAIVQSFGMNSYLVYNRVGRPRLTAIVNGIHLLIFIPALIWGASNWGTTGAAWAVTTTSILPVIADYVILPRIFAIRMREIVSHIWRPVLATACMAFVLGLPQKVLYVPHRTAESLPLFVFAVILGAGSYMSSILLLWCLSGRPPGAERYIWGVINGFGQKVRTYAGGQQTSRAFILASEEVKADSIIVFGPDNWNDHRQTRHHVASTFAARGWRVTYTNGPHFKWEISGPKWRHARWRTVCGSCDGVALNWPGRLQLRWPRFRAWDKYIQRRFTQALFRQAGWANARYRIAYVFHPRFYPYLFHLGDCYVVYHADDSFSKMFGDLKELCDNEEKLVARADLIVATSAGVRRNLPGDGPTRAKIVSNGADVETFIRESTHECPSDLAQIPHPRIGYFGTINPKLDLRLVAELAERRPTWHWVFVGSRIDRAIAADPVSCIPWETLRKLPNIHLLGSKPYLDIPRYQAHTDVNVLCYRTDPGGWWEDISPLKLYEYLAVGRPVVASNLESVRSLRHVLAIANNREEWIARIEDALTGSGVGSFEQRRDAARANSWNGIVSRLEHWLLEGQRPSDSEEILMRALSVRNPE